MHVISSLGLCRKSSGADTQETEVPVQQVEQQRSDGNAADECGCLPVQVSGNGDVHHSHERNGDIGEYARKSKLQYVSIQYVHIWNFFNIQKKRD